MSRLIEWFVRCLLGIQMCATLLFGLCGCYSSGNKYVEGTNLALGLYIPGDANVYGLQVVHYLNGCKVTTFTNQPFVVERQFSSTNTYFGVVHTSESTKTKVEIR